MSTEEGAPAESVEVVWCEAPSLVVRIGPEGRAVTVRIEGDDDEASVSLEQDITDARCWTAASVSPASPTTPADRRVFAHFRS